MLLTKDLRCWNPKIGQMIYDINIKNLSYLRDQDTFSETGAQIVYDFDHLIWMNFIMLKDHNNTKIYEKDIIEVYNNSDGNPSFKGIVEYEPQGAQFIIKNGNYYREIQSMGMYCDERGIILTNVIKIGNIYQNPELLNI